MKIKEAMAEAARTNDGRLAGRITDHLRFKAGMTYKEIADMAGRAGVSADAWETLMEAADLAEGEST